jgi:hypothetical protein
MYKAITMRHHGGKYENVCDVTFLCTFVTLPLLVEIYILKIYFINNFFEYSSLQKNPEQRKDTG